jgi:hypothetical protein
MLGEIVRRELAALDIFYVPDVDDRQHLIGGEELGFLLNGSGAFRLSQR